MARKPSQAGPIALYGATGYTGRLVAAELRRREVDFVLSGRNRAKLDALAAELGGAPVEVATVEDPSSLRALLEGAAAVINCAGPFARFGEPVVRAAIDTGTHYVDTTGEQTFMKLVFDRHDAAARAAGVAVVCAMGFDYVPGDLAARLAAEGLEPLDELRVAYAVHGFGASRGTLRTTLGIVAAPWIVYRDGTWRKAPAILERQEVDFPGPAGRQLCVTYPSGEVLTVPRHTQVRDVVTLINATTFVPVKQVAGVAPFVVPGLKALLRTPLRAALEKLVERGAEGPSPAARARSEFTVMADARGREGSRRVTVRGSDVYGLTAVIAVHGALLQAQQGFDRSGALAPAAAFDARAFLTHLGDHGVTFDAGAAAPAAGPAVAAA